MNVISNEWMHMGIQFRFMLIHTQMYFQFYLLNVLFPKMNFLFFPSSTEAGRCSWRPSLYFYFYFFLKALDVMVSPWHYKNKQWLATTFSLSYNSQMAQYSKLSDNVSTTENRTHNILLLLQTQLIMGNRWKPWEGMNKEKYTQESKVFLLHEQEG